MLLRVHIFIVRITVGNYHVEPRQVNNPSDLYLQSRVQE